MNREIKFRAWDLKREMYFYDDDVFNDASITAHYRCQITNKGIYWTKPFDKSKNTIVVDENGREGYTDWDYDLLYGNVEIEQFTGLKDKNGVDIYEGDILDLHQTINGCNLFSVEWCQKRLGWTLRYVLNMVNPRTYEYDVADVFTIEEIEVVGNVHQNPNY